MEKLKNVVSYANIIGKNAKSVDALIQAAVGSGKAMREKVQVAAVAILMHAEKHGDYTKANELVDGMGDGVNCAGLVEWFKKYGGLVVDEENKCFGGWSGAEYIRDNFKEAKASGWWELKKQSPWKGFDLEAELEKLLKRAQDANKKLAKAEQEGDTEAYQDLKGKINAPVELIHKLREAKKAA